MRKNQQNDPINWKKRLSLVAIACFGVIDRNLALYLIKIVVQFDSQHRFGFKKNQLWPVHLTRAS